MTAAAGLVLVADPEWLDYHAEHSQGTNVAFYRGVGGRVASLNEGGPLFCARKGEVPRRVHAYGMFCGNEIRRHDEIWARFKSQLGADSEDRWRKLASVVLQNSEKKGGKICAIRLAGYRSLPAPIDPKDAGIDINSQMQKGHNLTRAEVDALLGTISPVLVYGREDQIPTLAQLDDELEAAVNESSQGDPDARQERLQRAPTFPKKLTVTSVAFRRNPDVIAEVLERAKGRCELCEQDAPFLRASDGSPYLEVHHRRPLGEGGEDTVENGQALCPNCHREVHYG